VVNGKDKYNRARIYETTEEAIARIVASVFMDFQELKGILPIR